MWAFIGCVAGTRSWKRDSREARRASAERERTEGAPGASPMFSPLRPIINMQNREIWLSMKTLPIFRGKIFLELRSRISRMLVRNEKNKTALRHVKTCFEA